MLLSYDLKSCSNLLKKSDANRNVTINISNLNKKYTTEWQCGTELLAWIDWSLVKKIYINLIYQSFI